MKFKYLIEIEFKLELKCLSNEKVQLAASIKQQTT